MAIRIQLRRDTAANWTSVNPVLANGEMGIETDTLKAKVGNGSAAWSARPYINVLPSELAELSQDAVNSAIVAGTGLDKTYNDESNTITLDIDSTVATKAFAAELLTNATKSNIVITGDQNGLTITAENGVADSTTDNLQEGSTNKYFTDERAQDAVGNALGNGLKYTDSTGAIEPNLTTAGGLKIDLDGKLAADSQYVTFNTTEQTLTNKTLTSPKVNENVALTATSSELNILDGATLSTTELNYVDGVTSAIQTQIDNKASLAGATFTGAVSGTSLTLSGDLTVNGTTTNINSTNLTVEDKNIILGDTATPTDATADGGGITLKGSTDKTLVWSDSTDSWTSSENVNLASGKSYNLNGTNIKDVSETLTNKTLTSPIITSPTVSGLYLSDNSVTFEGQGGDDQYETILSVENPTADRTIILPDASDHMVGRATEDTLTNKTLTLPKINDNTLLTATSTELNVLDGITASTSELNKLDGVTASTSEINTLTGITATTIELNYVDGVTSAIQTQLDSKQPKITGVSDTEIGYLDGVTSAIQTQIDSKLAKAGGTMSGAIAMGNNNITGLGTPSAVDHAANKGYVDTGVSSANATTTTKIGDATVDGSAGNTITARIATAVSDAADYTDLAVSGLSNTVSSDYVPVSIVGQADGVASLDSFGYVPLTELNDRVVLTVDGTIPLNKLDSEVVIKTTVQTLTNKTLTSPKINEDVILTATSTELNYVDGVTSNIQTQLDAKSPLASPAFTGTVILPDNTISNAMMKDNSVDTAEIQNSAITEAKIANLAVTNDKLSGSIDWTKLAISSTVSSTELGYVDGVTSSIQTQLDSKLNLSGGTMTGALTLSAAPTSDLHAATKLYVDNVTAGINFHESVHAASISNLATIYNNGTSGVGATLTADTNRAFSTLDGESVVVGQRVLIKNQTDSKQNGIYTLTTVGSGSAPWVLTRATDADNNPAGEMKAGDFVFVQNGTINASIGYINNSTANPIVIGTSNITYTEFNAGKTIVAGTGLTEATPGILSIDTAVTANLSGAQTLTNKTFVAPVLGAATATSINGTVIPSSAILVETTDVGIVSNTMIADEAINDAKVSTTAGIAQSKISGLTTDLDAKAPKASPVFTGTITLPLTNAGYVTTTSSGVISSVATIPNSGLTNNSITLGSVTAVLGDTVNTIDGLTSITSTTFTGDLIGNADTVTNGVVTTEIYTNPGWLSLDRDMVGLNLVDNVSIYTWGGGSSLNTVGEITSGTWSGSTIALNKGGTGATTQQGAATAILPFQSPYAGQFLTTDGNSVSWAPVPVGYYAPTIGSTLIESGVTYTGFADLLLGTPTINDAIIDTATMTGVIIVPTPTANSHAATKLYTDTTATTAANTAAATERTYTNERLDIVPLDDISTNFNGSNTRFMPTVAGSQITISNPLRLLVSINGIIQMLGNQDNHWLSPIPPDGFYIDGDGYIEFSEPVPTGSTFDGRLMPGKTSNTLEKSRYPFRATDILLGA
jgi:hypothetical protein